MSFKIWSLLYLSVWFFGATPKSDAKEKDVVVALLDAGANHEHQKKIENLFKNEWKSCSDCKLESFPIYDSLGNQNPEIVMRSLEKAKVKSQILHLSWNIEFTPQWQSVIDQLNQLIEKENILVVAASGARDSNLPGTQINKTVMGKVKGVFLIGELGVKNRMPPNSFFGTEIFTAFRAPVGLSGSSFSSVLFTARLAREFSRKTPQQWRAHLTEKNKYRIELWPSLDYFFK